jgi:tetratricopeptide (TPR) repeat protein
MGAECGCVFLALALAATGWGAPQREEALKHFERGRELYEVHDDTGETAQEAEAEFRRALERDPRFAPAIAYLGFLAADRQQPDQAEAGFRRALEIDSHCAEARVGIARLDLAANRYSDALRELRQAVADHPDHRLARRDLGFTLTIESAHPTPEMWDEAIRSWQVLVRLDANDRDAHHELAKACEQRGRWAEAERHYREVLRIGQTDEDSDVWVYTVHGNLARMLERQGKYREAIQEYETLVGSEGAGEEEIKDARAQIAALEKRLR